MSKTAMQEMLAYIRSTLPMDLDWPRMLESRAESLLKKEKEQIKDAWDSGMSEGIGTMMADLDWDGEFVNYYNETYNKNK